MCAHLNADVTLNFIQDKIRKGQASFYGWKVLRLGNTSLSNGNYKYVVGENKAKENDGWPVPKHISDYSENSPSGIHFYLKKSSAVEARYGSKTRKVVRVRINVVDLVGMESPHRLGLSEGVQGVATKIYIEKEDFPKIS